MAFKRPYSARRFACCFLALCFVLLASCTPSPETPELSVDPEQAYPMTVTFLNIGEADCFLIESPSGCVMIDTGTNKDGNGIVELLNEKKIGRIDYLFITHFDKDHVGGADRILHAVPVGTIYEPDYASDSKQTAQYRAAVGPDTDVVKLSQNLSFTFDGIRYTVDVANGTFTDGKDQDNVDNNMSLVVHASCGNTSVLFTGDAEKDRLYEMLYEGFPPCTLLKVPHHGVAEKYLRQFCDRVKPQYAVITSSDKEPESDAVVRDLTDMGIQVFLTRKGRIVFTTDGSAVSIRQDTGEKP